MNAELRTTARALVAPGKGILAADESSGTIKKRFDTINTESTEDTRRQYREMLFTTPGSAEHISGVILYDETIRQSASSGRTFVDVLAGQGVIPGIKVDTGAHPLAFSPDEKVTEGLDGLRARFEEYAKLGAKFAKWRAVIDIKGDALPTTYCVDVNAQGLARYAALAQETGLVPIVEPEILMDGDHTIERCYEVTIFTLQRVFAELFDQRVVFEEMLLKPNMVVAGKKCATQPANRAVAEMTIAALRTAVPAAVPGIVFLSGGMSDEDATDRLNEMNKIGGVPWELSFSYGRALQAPALKAWKGEAANVEAGQRAYLHRAKMNSKARSGSYKPSDENAA